MTRAIAAAAALVVVAAGCGQASSDADPGGQGEAGAASSAAPSSGERTGSEPLDGKVVVIDPGHNGGNAEKPKVINREVDALTQRKACDTTGTAAESGYPEHKFTWDVSKRLADVLEQRGATVELTRDDDRGVGPCITERAAIGNRAEADAAISIHADGSVRSRHRGFHVIRPDRISSGETDEIIGPSRRLGHAIRDAYRSGTGAPYSNYRGKKGIDVRDDLGGLNLSTRPKVFLEAGNMKNEDEAAKMGRAKYRARIAAALGDGFQAYFEDR